MPQITTLRDALITNMEGMAEAIRHRIDPSAALSGNGRRFRDMTLVEMATEHLASCGASTSTMSSSDIANPHTWVKAAGGAQGASDFGNILADVARKSLRASYDAVQPGYRLWARRAPNLRDYRPADVVRVADLAKPSMIAALGTYEFQRLEDAGETYSIVRYGSAVGISREAFINDNLRAFSRVVLHAGDSCARLENDVVVRQLTSNAAMSDSVALFHASHGNLSTGAGSALAAATGLSGARKSMRTQTNSKGEPLNLVPAWLIVPAALEGAAYAAANTETARQVSGIRPQLVPVIEPLLDATSENAWYLAAANSQVDTIEYCWLGMQDGPEVMQKVDFDSDRLLIKFRLEFAAKAIDHTGLHRADGA